MSEVAVVLGATGTVGGGAARALLRAGLRVVCPVRDAATRCSSDSAAKDARRARSAASIREGEKLASTLRRRYGATRPRSPPRSYVSLGKGRYLCE